MDDTGSYSGDEILTKISQGETTLIWLSSGGETICKDKVEKLRFGLLASQLSTGEGPGDGWSDEESALHSEKANVASENTNMWVKGSASNALRFQSWAFLSHWSQLWFWKLFAFGNGTYSVLGHRDQESVRYPRDVESLSGFTTISVACGVWLHPAAVVKMAIKLSWSRGQRSHGQNQLVYHHLLSTNFTKLLVDIVDCWIDHIRSIFITETAVYSQLGNPCFKTVEEIACGAYHVAVLTSRNEGYTCRMGAKGRLGHGDIEYRKMPTLVEALEDRHVKFVPCGSNYGAALCLHKWISVKFQKLLASGRSSGPHPSGVLPFNMDLINQLDTKAVKKLKKTASSQTPFTIKDAVLSSSEDVKHAIPKPAVPPSGASSTSSLVSPFSRKLSPSHSATPVPVASGLFFPKSVADSLKKTNGHLNKECCIWHGRKLDATMQTSEVRASEIYIESSRGSCTCCRRICRD
ncbi:LOW QUALITY PROTEIN: hypothetical protein Cgig2_009926 [Carnegiea gigantea]|uniref:Uncharacterized protein n=1 Tax=Carnegiea gigantea TaxID=171969 RepID=A0A9Q1K365_9CARY|nr:LOW QUALITY PROTEIN: hypothetical protein Cgig2_009926 [Carnegiea gigantea]